MELKAYPFICVTLRREVKFSKTISKQVFFDKNISGDVKFSKTISKQVFFDSRVSLGVRL